MVVGPCSPSVCVCVWGVVRCLAVLLGVGVPLLFLEGFGALLSFSVWVVCVGLVVLFYLGWLGPFACLFLFRSSLGHCPPFLFLGIMLAFLVLAMETMPVVRHNISVIVHQTKDHLL